MVDTSKVSPPQAGILPARFKCIDYVQEKFIAVWDTGDIINPKKAPEIWFLFEYWNEATRESASTRLRYITGLLNGSRDLCEIASIK